MSDRSESHKTRIADVGGVAVPVSDQERAVRFYVDKLGFEVRRDVAMADGGRWVQVSAPSGRVMLALIAAGDGVPIAVDTGITFATTDAESDHASLVSRGVDTDDVLRWPGVPTMFILRDQDGNQLKVMETA